MNEENKLVRKELSAVVKDLGEGVIEAIVSTQDVDRHGEVVDMKGLDTTQYMQNPVVAWAHKYDELPVAQTLSLKKTKDGKLMARMKFAIEESDFARTIYRLYKGGFLRAFSIGFIPEKMESNRYTKSTMLEYSAVLVPANPHALVTAKSKGINVDFVKKVADGEAKPAEYKELEIPNSDIMDYLHKLDVKLSKIDKHFTHTVAKSSQVNIRALNSLLRKEVKK